jgi:serine/threonine-protein kinase CHEK1
MLDAAGTLKISDFGLCSVFRIEDKATGQSSISVALRGVEAEIKDDDIGKKKTRQLTERCGSLPYVAPEVNFNLHQS